MSELDLVGAHTPAVPAPGAPAGALPADAAVLEGTRRVLAALPDIERLATGLGVPVTARTPWIRAQLDALDVEAWAVLLRGMDGELLAAAVVLDAGPDGLELAGGGEGHCGAVIAADEQAATSLGRRLAIEASRRGHRGVAGLLPEGRLTRALADGLGADLRLAPAVPVIVPDLGPDLAAYLSHGMLRTLRKARNRLLADDRKAEIVVTRRGEEIVAMLPAMEQAYRDRDERHGVDSPLADELGRRRWRAQIRRLLEHRCLELATLTVDAELAAYVVGLDDGPWYRVLDGRIDARFGRYSPGRLLESAVLDRALSAGVQGVDWMTSVAPETLLAATGEVPVVELTPRS
jgi:CelD/BcsL family acetyltransferase involved in cellulose biosynthesis